MSTNQPQSSKKAASIVGLAIMGSRLMGLVREQVFAYFFGATMYADVFATAFRIPNLLRDLFAEGALSTAFTTTFTKLWTKEGPAAAWRLAEIVISVLILILGLICFIGIFASPLIVWALSPGFIKVEGKYEAAVAMTELLFPFILYVSLAAVAMGMLNARNIFGLPASASTVFNIVSVVSGVLFAFIFEPQTNWRHAHFGLPALYGMCLGVLLGGIAQLGIQLPALWKLGLRFNWRPYFNDPALRTVLALMIPSAIAGSAVQINVLISGEFASYINGANAWLNYAFRFVQLPIGIFGVAIATVTLPAVARQHALDDLTAFGKTVEEALRFVFYLTLPASVGLAVVAHPLIELVYQHGAFTTEATTQTAWALQAYTVGLAGYSGIKILVPCFYAMNETRTPLRVSFMGIGLSLVLNLVLFFYCGMGHVGLALTTGLIAVLNFLQLVVAIQKKIALGKMSDWINFLARVVLASAACGLVAYEALDFAWPYGWKSFGVRVTILFLTVGLGGLTYLLMTILLQLPESMQLVRFIRRKSGLQSHGI